MSAHEILAVALGRVLAAGHRPPCAGGPDWWVSDHAEIRARAAELCSDCPLVSPCEVAGRDEDFGVWGGVDRSQATPAQRRGRRAQRQEPA